MELKQNDKFLLKDFGLASLGADVSPIRVVLKPRHGVMRVSADEQCH